MPVFASIALQPPKNWFEILLKRTEMGDFGARGGQKFFYKIAYTAKVYRCSFVICGRCAELSLLAAIF